MLKILGIRVTLVEMSARMSLKKQEQCNDVEYAYGEKVQTVLKAIARSCKESNGMISDSMLNIQLLQLMPQL